MTDQDATELARLRARAYGAGGVPLTTAEMKRLRVLEHSLRPRDEHRADERGTPDEAPESETPVRPSRGWERVAFIALAALLPIAAFGGFLAASLVGGGPPAPAVAGTPLLASGDASSSYEDRRAVVLRSQEWDAGRVELLAGAQGISVWWGTQGENTCVAVDVAQEGTGVACAETDRVRSQGIRIQSEFFHVTEGESAAPGVIDVTDSIAQRTTFIGNPYTGQFLVVRG